MLYNSILIPIDLAHPEAATAMFEKGKALMAPGGKITIIHAMPDIPPYVASEMPQDFLLDSATNANGELREIARAAGVEAEVHVVHGQAPRAILAMAETEKADLIIVASHRPGLADYLLGSTAARVVRHAQCSVLVIR